CVSVSAPFGVFHVPATLAGTTQNNAVHQLLEQPSVTVAVSSACQSSIVKVLVAMRVPGLRSRIFGRSFMLIEGSRNIVITSAFDRSVSKRSALMNVARSDTPAAFALFCESVTMSGLYSMP